MTRKSWTLENLLKEVSKYRTLKDFRTQSESAYKACLERGLKDQLLSHLEGRTYWSHESVLKLGSTFTERNKFQSGNNSAYNYAREHKLLDLLFPHSIRSKVVWDRESVAEESKKHKNRSTFKYNASGAYTWAYENDTLDELFGTTLCTPFCDNDVVYIWKVFGQDIYKIGKSSSRLKKRRLRYVERKSGLTIEEYHLFVVGDAKQVECLLLQVGSRYEFETKFSGSTEFRTLTKDEYKKCLEILEHSKINQEEGYNSFSNDRNTT